MNAKNIAARLLSGTGIALLLAAETFAVVHFHLAQNAWNNIVDLTSWIISAL